MVQAWPDLWGCTGAMLGVAGVGAGTGATSGTAGACGFGVTGIVGATDGGSSSCAGLADAGSGAEMWGLAGACSVAVVMSEVVSVGLTLFTKVSSHVAVDHAITGAHLVAVFWQDTYHSGRDPDLMEGFIHSNRLASIQGCKGFALFVCL